MTNSIDRILRMTDKTEDCWIWRGCKQQGGKGRIGWKGRLELVHRVIYQELVEPIPKGMHILHSCNNGSCINPAHLRLGTQSDNNRDRYRDGGYKIKPSYIPDIIEMRDSGMTLAEIATHYGVDQATIHYALKRSR